MEQIQLTTQNEEEHYRLANIRHFAKFGRCRTLQSIYQRLQKFV